MKGTVDCGKSFLSFLPETSSEPRWIKVHPLPHPPTYCLCSSNLCWLFLALQPVSPDALPSLYSTGWFTSKPQGVCSEGAEEWGKETIEISMKNQPEVFRSHLAETLRTERGQGGGRPWVIEAPQPERSNCGGAEATRLQGITADRSFQTSGQALAKLSAACTSRHPCF